METHSLKPNMARCHRLTEQTPSPNNQIGQDPIHIHNLEPDSHIGIGPNTLPLDINTIWRVRNLNIRRGRMVCGSEDVASPQGKKAVRASCGWPVEEIKIDTPKQAASQSLWNTAGFIQRHQLYNRRVIPRHHHHQVLKCAYSMTA